MQVCNTLSIAFVETDMADMEGLRKQVAIRRAKLPEHKKYIITFLFSK